MCVVSCISTRGFLHMTKAFPNLARTFLSLWSCCSLPVQWLEVIKSPEWKCWGMAGKGWCWRSSGFPDSNHLRNTSSTILRLRWFCFLVHPLSSVLWQHSGWILHLSSCGCQWHKLQSTPLNYMENVISFPLKRVSSGLGTRVGAWKVTWDCLDTCIWLDLHHHINSLSH